MQRGKRCATPYAPTAATTVTRISIWDHFSHRDSLKGLLYAGSACPLHALRSFRVRKLQLVTPTSIKFFCALAKCHRNYVSARMRSGRAGPILSLLCESMQSTRGGAENSRRDRYLFAPPAPPAPVNCLLPIQWLCGLHCYDIFCSLSVPIWP